MRSKLGISSTMFCLALLSPFAVGSGVADAAPVGYDTVADSNAFGGPQPGPAVVGRQGWQVQSTAAVTAWTTGSGATQSGAEISDPGFTPTGWLPVAPDDAGAVGTEVEALLQNGVCPDDPGLQPVNQRNGDPKSIFYSDNMKSCFGPPQTSNGANKNPLFNLPWWFRTTFTQNPRPGQNARLVVNGIVGQADVWVNGTEVATQATVEGDYTSYTFDVSSLVRAGANSLALEVFPNNPATMLTLDDVDWNQIPPDNNTGIQFPILLHTSGTLGIGNTYVTQNDSSDLSSAALTVHADVTNNTAATRSATVSALITPPSGAGVPIHVSQTVSVPAGATQTVTFSPKAFGELVVRHPKLWWPYQMGGQPLYTLHAAVASSGVPSDFAAPVNFGVRSVTTYLTAPSAQAPSGVRIFEINGVPFDFRAGGWAENLFLQYSTVDLASQLTLIKSLGLDGIRTEGKEMPQDFYDRMDRAGVLVNAGFQCCDKWQPSGSGRNVTSQEFHVMYLSSLTIGQRLRDHPSVINFSWSDNTPINEQETASLAGFAQAGFEAPIIASAEYKGSGILGPSGEKEGPYDWVPSGYWYDTEHSSNNATDDDSSLTNVGGSFGFDSEEGSGDTVPTMDSIQRFMSPADQAALWQQPGAHQYHTNYESTAGQHTGYSFGTLANLDTAIQHRYGAWTGLRQYVQQAQVQNYEDTRAQFEAYLDHWNNYPTPSTGTIYWQLNKGWPTLMWDLYNNDYDQAGGYFGAKKANENLHVLYALDDGTATVDNLTGVDQPDVSVESKVYDLGGRVLDHQTSHGLTLAPQAVRNAVLAPKVPAATAPPAPAQTYFVELILRQHGSIVDRNVYWRSTQPDVLDWASTAGSPQANNGSPLSQYMDMTALQGLPSQSVKVAATTTARPGADGELVTSVTVTNPPSNSAVAFFLRADVRRGSASGVPQPGDNQILPIDWSDNDITLWPGQSETLTARYSGSLLKGAAPVVSLEGWNVPGLAVSAAQSRSAAQDALEHDPHVLHLGRAAGQPLATGTASPGAGARFRSASTSQHGSTGPAWTITSVANSPSTTPSTSFTQGDAADTYTVTLTNSGTTATDGTTPVTVTDVRDPNVRLVSLAGPGWTCVTSDDPTEVCTQTGGPDGHPAVLQPGESYPPLTLTEQVPARTGFATQDSTAGLHVTNAVSVAGGAPSVPSASITRETPIVGVPNLTADNAVDGAFRQGDKDGQYQITVINQGGGPTNGDPATPIVATVTVPAGESISALYGSGWTCNLAAITTPYTEPANTCYRTDVLAGSNGQAPPITVVAGVTLNAPASGNETVVVSGGGEKAAPSSVAAATVIAQSADLTVAGTHAGTFAQGDAADTYTLTVSDVKGPNTTGAGGSSLGLVTVTDTLPWGLTATAMSGAGWTCRVAVTTCYRSDQLAAGSSYPPVTLTVSVAGNAPATVTNSVTVAGGGMTSGPNSSTSGGGQSADDVTAIGQSAAPGTPPAPGLRPVLTLASAHPGAFAQGDRADSYTLTVSDASSAGPVAGMVTVVDTPPAGLTPTRIAGKGWTCTLAPAVLPGSPNTFEPRPTCYRFDPLAPGASYPPITMTVAVTNTARPQVGNSATVSGGGSAAPVTADDATAVAGRPQLAVSAVPVAGGLPYAPFAQGDRAGSGDGYDIVVANDGYSATQGRVTFGVDLPAGLTALSMSGAGWSCRLDTTTCTTDAGVVLAAGAQSRITLRVAVARSAPQSMQTLMQASGGGEIPNASIGQFDHNDALSNGGEYVVPTYVTAT